MRSGRRLGPAAEWSGDLDALVSHYFEPGTDRTYFRRVWLNQPVAGAGRAFDVSRWHELKAEAPDLESDNLIVLGFDGARRRDATALVATHVETRHISGWSGYGRSPIPGQRLGGSRR